MDDINFQSLDPAERDWEYDGDGTRIYKVKAGFIGKTPYDDEYEKWKERFGHEWQPEEEPYYVGLPQEELMRGESRHCGDCGHRCHCYQPECTEEIGVGMSDKTQECKCKECKCGKTK